MDLRPSTIDLAVHDDVAHVARPEAEENVSREVRRRQRRGRVVLEDDPVPGRGPTASSARRWLCGEKSDRVDAAHRPVRLPGAQVRDARLREEVAVHPVRAEGDARAEGLHVGISHGVLEIAARVVSDPGSGVLDARALSRRKVNAVGEERLRPESPGAVETLEGFRIAAILGRVKVQPGSFPPRQIRGRVRESRPRP